MFPLITMVANGIARTIAVMVTVSIINAYLLIIFGVAISVMYFVLRHAVGHLRECQKLDSKHRGPTIDEITQKLSGLLVLRSYKQLDLRRE